MIFLGETEIELSQRNPAGFPAPPYMDDLLPIGQKSLEFGARFRRGVRLQLGQERERAGLNRNGHRDYSISLPGASRLT
jgi:hypothetical protein